ncbi:biotin transporter BioY [Methermicoccus shengliensis]|nr:biotin transporter BioY [Methermicoccus shengliensis]
MGGCMEFLSGYRRARLRLFEWRSCLEWEYKLLLALGFAALTGLAAQVVIFLPWTPVPITAQTFAVLVGAVVLGRHWGGVGQLIYVALGAIGVPWFYGMSGGYEHLLGASGGYLLGFVVAAWLVGYLSDTHPSTRRAPSLLGLFLLATVVIYGLGLLQLYAWLCAHSTPPTLLELLIKGVLPFLPGDILKAVLASGCAWAIVPKERFC